MRRYPMPPRVAPLVGLILVALAVSWTPADAQDSRRIGPRDQLQIRVDELPALPVDHLVTDDGTISLGVAGRIEVQGLDAAQLEQRIQEQLMRAGLRRATVRVEVTAFRSRPVTVLGAVGTPGNLDVPGRSTLLDVILGAGGLAPSHGQVVRVRRRSEDGLSDQVEVPLDALFERAEPDANLPIFPGDVVTVPAAREVTILLMGEFASVGSQTFLSDEPVHLLTVVARAGGLTETASSKLLIQRKTEDGGRREIEIDFKRILNGKEPDVELQDGDLLVAKESFF